MKLANKRGNEVGPEIVDEVESEAINVVSNTQLKVCMKPLAAKSGPLPTVYDMLSGGNTTLGLDWEVSTCACVSHAPTAAVTSKTLLQGLRVVARLAQEDTKHGLCGFLEEKSIDLVITGSATTSRFRKTLNVSPLAHRLSTVASHSVLPPFPLACHGRCSTAYRGGKQHMIPQSYAHILVCSWCLSNCSWGRPPSAPTSCIMRPAPRW